ncbi:unnamed protein product [Dicrocoelium dendriticum]|nr:unnamed protein product [Dicrocoelium dendriticum]
MSVTFQFTRQFHILDQTIRGPGSGRTEQAQALCEKLPGLIHFNLTDFLRNRVLDRIGVDSQKDWDVIARRVHSSDPPMSKDRIIPEYWVSVSIISFLIIFQTR